MVQSLAANIDDNSNNDNDTDDDNNNLVLLVADLEKKVRSISKNVHPFYLLQKAEEIVNAAEQEEPEKYQLLLENVDILKTVVNAENIISNRIDSKQNKNIISYLYYYYSSHGTDMDTINSFLPGSGLPSLSTSSKN